MRTAALCEAQGMRAIVTALLLLCMSLPALAQENSSRWFGVKLRDVTATEADALGWDDPHGARVLAVKSGSPAAAAGVLRGDVLVLLDGVEIANATSFNQALAKRETTAPFRLTVRRGARQKRLRRGGAAARPWRATTTPKQGGTGPRSAGTPAPTHPLLVLDTGGHAAPISGIAFAANGRHLVTASTDKTIRVWDVARARTMRTIRGEIGPGHAGEVLAIATKNGSAAIATVDLNKRYIDDWLGDMRARFHKELRLDVPVLRKSTGR